MPKNESIDPSRQFAAQLFNPKIYSVYALSFRPRLRLNARQSAALQFWAALFIVFLLGFLGFTITKNINK